MSQFRIKLFCIFFLFNSHCLMAQPSPDINSTLLTSYYTPKKVLAFSNFLFKQGDFTRAAAEYQRYLYIDDDSSSSEQSFIHYQLGHCYLQMNRIKNAISYFSTTAQTASRNTLRDSALIAYSTTLLMAKHNATFFRVYDSLFTTSPSTALQASLIRLKAIAYLSQGEWGDVNTLLNENKAIFASRESQKDIQHLKKLAHKGKHSLKKSPFKAGFMSAVIPGSGRIYAGRVADGIYSFIIIGGTGWLAYEGYRDNGVNSFKGWFFGALSSAFYVSGIYGSVVTARMYNNKSREKLEKNIQFELNLTINI